MRIILTTVVLALTASTAHAADIIVAPEVIVAPDTFTWSGAYIGINGGYAFGKGEIRDVTQPELGSLSYIFNSKFDVNGYAGGVQAGYNYQFQNNFVIGTEADFQWMSFDGSSDNDPNYKASVKMKWLSTIRARLGYAYDRTLFYTTGGLAVAKIDVDTFAYQEDGYLSGAKTHVGYTVGAGVEHAFTDHITAKFEYNYVDIGKKDYTLSDTGPYNYSDGNGKGIGYGSLFRVGLNYKF